MPGVPDTRELCTSRDWLTSCIACCSVCGVQSFYEPRSHPGAKAVTAQCLDPGTVESVKVQKFEGTNWEESMAKHDRAASTS